MASGNGSGTPDRSLLMGGEESNVREFAVAAGVSLEEARELVDRLGDNPDRLRAAAKAQRESQMTAGQIRH